MLRESHAGIEMKGFSSAGREIGPTLLRADSGFAREALMAVFRRGKRFYAGGRQPGGT
jgi:hypothetical protein